jgi:phage terminase large subunit-like protein
VAGISEDGYGYVLEDRTVNGSPNTWGRKAVTGYHKYNADRIVGEVNQGGDMVETVIRTVDKQASYKEVRATRGKQLRAEPIAALYEQGKIFHAKGLEKLEDELTTWDPETSKDSPNRLDALVWALTELMLNNQSSWGWN